MTGRGDISVSRRRRSIRLAGYDYTQPGAYFVTILTRDRNQSLSQIIMGEIKLSTIGKMIDREWLRLPQRFPAIQLNEWVIMPDHIHGIIILTDDRKGTGEPCLENHIDIHPRAPTTERFGEPVA